MKNEYKILTFNVRSRFEADGENIFDKRVNYIAETIESRRPDVIGFQELTDYMRTMLVPLLPDYYIVGGCRESSRGGESSCIAFLKDKFMLERLESIMLSNRTAFVGSRFGGRQSICSRIFSVATLMPFDMQAKPFRIYNAHTDHESDDARLLAASQIVTKICDDNAVVKMPFIITGDLNAPPHTKEIKFFTTHPEIKINDLTADIDGTYHAFGTIPEKIKIDYIMASEEIELISNEKWDKKQGEIFLSDHDAICATVQI